MFSTFCEFGVPYIHTCNQPNQLRYETVYTWCMCFELIYVTQHKLIANVVVLIETSIIGLYRKLINILNSNNTSNRPDRKL